MYKTLIDSFRVYGRIINIAITNATVNNDFENYLIRAENAQVLVSGVVWRLLTAWWGLKQRKACQDTGSLVVMFTMSGFVISGPRNVDNIFAPSASWRRRS